MTPSLETPDRLKPSEVETPERPNTGWGFWGYLAVILAVFAFLSASILFNHLRIETVANSAPTRRVKDLVNLLTQAEEKQRSLEKEITGLQGRLENLDADSGTIGQRAARNIAHDPEYRKLMRQAGLTEISGGGIVVRLIDTGADNPANSRGADGNRVQSEDLLRVVNDLRAAGATAVAINGQRLVSTSAIINAGPSLMINQSRIEPPIEIRALGDADTLRAALKIRGGILEYLNFFGIQADIEAVPKLEIPPYKPLTPIE